MPEAARGDQFVTAAVTMAKRRAALVAETATEIAKILVKSSQLKVSSNLRKTRLKFGPNVSFIANDRFKPVC
ncbi:MAG: hypothetical protein JSR72_22895 [Proteobacteria bacterium]|nr:hypothetical protein [Pseudomonadota bacterium]